MFDVEDAVREQVILQQNVLKKEETYSAHKEKIGLTYSVKEAMVGI